jgi:hypothetical protein
MRNLKDIRALRERHDPEDYKREVDSDAEVKDWEPRSKREKDFVGKHNITKKGYPKETDAFDFDLPKSDDTSKSVGGEKTPIVQGKNKSVHNIRQLKKEDVEVAEEEVLEEAVSTGDLKLRDGSTVSISSNDAKIVNNVLASLNPENRKRMEDELKKNKKSFEKIMTFAKNQD